MQRLFTFLLFLSGTALAGDPNLERLAAYIDGFQKEYRALPNQTPALVQQASESLEQLQRSVPADEWPKWEALIDWPTLQVALQSSPPDPKLLGLLTRRFFVNRSLVDGNRAFLKSREDLTALVDYLVAAKRTPWSSVFESRIREIAHELRQDSPSNEVLSRAFHWLVAMKQVPEMVATAQRQLQKGNLIIHFPLEVIEDELKSLSQTIDEKQFTQSTVSGAQVQGWAYIKGTLVPEFIEGTPARIRLYLNAEVLTPHSQATQSIPILQGSVTIATSGKTQVFATQDLFWDGEKFAGNRIQIHATTQSQRLPGIGIQRRYLLPARLALGRRMQRRFDQRIRQIAARAAEKKRDEGEKQASKMVEAQLSRRLKDQVESFLAQANRKINENFMDPVRRLGLRFGSLTSIEENKLKVIVLRTTAGGVGAPFYPPKRTHRGDLRVAIHESVISAFTRPLTGGAFWDRQMWEAEREKHSPLNQREDDPISDWGVRFNWIQPWYARVQPDGLNFGIQVDMIQIGEERLESPAKIEATYEIQLGKTIPELYRIGDVRVIDLSGELPPQAKTFLLKRFRNIFLEQLYLGALGVPIEKVWSNLGNPATRDLSYGHGWLTVDYQTNGAP